MFLSDVMVFVNGVMVCESEGIRLGMGGMVSGSEEMKEADFVSASCRLASDAINSNLTRVLFAFRVTFSSFFVFRSSFSSCVFTLAGLRQRDRPI